MNIDPRGMSIKTWCDWNVSAMAHYGQIPFLQDENKWKDWAMSVIKNPGIAGLNPPDPRYFDNFLEWAERFNSAVPL